MQFVVRARLLQKGEVFFLIGGAGVIEDDHADRMAIAPEMFVVVLDGLAHIPQPICGNDEKQLLFLHTVDNRGPATRVQEANSMPRRGTRDKPLSRYAVAPRWRKGSQKLSCKLQLGSCKMHGL
jgi:hypothetical protein